MYNDVVEGVGRYSLCKGKGKGRDMHNIFGIMLFEGLPAVTFSTESVQDTLHLRSRG